MKTLALFLVAPLLLPALAAAATCDHPYFPLRDGMRITYQSSAPNETAPRTLSVTVTKVGGGKATVETVHSNEKDKAPLTVDLVCSASEGVQFDFSSLAGGAGGKKMKEVKRTGMDFPAASKFKAGEKWDTSQTVQVEMGDKTLTVETKAVHSVEGTETVTVPAGTFDAVKIQVESDSTTTGAGQMPPFHLSQTFWVSKGVGLVKGAMGKRTTELVSYTR
jgi:hypothetical protein